MRIGKTILFLCVLFCVFIDMKAQTQLFEENFDYSNGVLSDLSSDWSESPTGSVDINVMSGNLIFTDYPSSGTGNKIAVDGGATGRSGVLKTFTSQSGDGNSLYASFLLNVTSTSDMDISTSDGDYFFNLKITGSSALRSCVFVRQGSSSAKYQIGIGKLNSSTPSWFSTELDISTTYLVVIAYIFQSGDDAVRFWLNPSLAGSEPTADLEQTAGADASDLGDVQIRQRQFSGDMEIDGLRIADSWSLAPLPVELTSFSAIKTNGGIRLEWQTETEVNNYGFEVERLSSSDIQGWNKIGFVEGHGNSNSPKEYSLVDNDIQNGQYAYRLKQIDNDGTFEYSKIIDVDANTVMQYKLDQNFPNPFNPTTEIKFSIPVSSMVNIKVFNILGQEVEVLLNQHLEAGNHSVNFNASAFNSGIYFYRIEAGNFVKIKKMTLLK